MAKAPLQLDWDDILHRPTDSPPPELKVVPSSSSAAALAGEGEAGQSGEVFPVGELPNHQLREKIQRLEAQIKCGISARLSDGGAKLRSSLRQAQHELNRRQLPKLQMDAVKCEKATQPKITESLGSFNDLRPNSVSFETCPQSSFASQFSQKLEDKADAAFSGELRFISRDKYKNSSENGWQMHREKHPAQVSSQPARMCLRKRPFRCFVDKHKEIYPDNDRNLSESSPNPSSHEQRNSSRHFAKRRASGTWKTPISKLKDIVLLDEEGIQPRQPMQGDNPAEWKEAKIYYPSRDDPESVELSYSDIKCLDPESYLSSPIMNFYIQYLQRSLSSIGRSGGNYHIFNTYFYKKLEEAVSCKGDKSASFMKLRRWWKGVNLFEKAYIFLPIHGNMHWSLAIICFPRKESESGPIVLHLDSLGIHTSNPIFDIVDSYIKDEWNFINNNALEDLPLTERIWRNLPCQIKKKKIMVPQQKNEYDCGLFVLYFMERFIRDAPERFTKKDYNMFGRKWFEPEEASSLRIRIRELLIEEFESARLENENTESSTSSGSSTERDNEQDNET